MKTTLKRTLLLFFTVLPFLAFSQIPSLIRSFQGSMADRGGEVVLKQSFVTTEGENTRLTFEVECPEAGNYYMSAWMMGVQSLGNDKSKGYNLYVNGTKTSGVIGTETGGWQTVPYLCRETESKIALTQGTNTISFSAVAPDIPEIEFIRFSKIEANALISDKAYKSFFTGIKERELQRPAVQSQERNRKVRSVAEESRTVLPNPEGIYHHHMNVPIKYTTYKTMSLQAGGQYSIYTYGAPQTGFRHVLEVFHSEYPETASWSAASDPTTGKASLNILIDREGPYYLKVRSYIPGEEGVVNLYVKKQGDIFTNLYADCPVTGTVFRDVTQLANAGIYDNFTSHSSGDSFLWLEDTSGAPGKIRAFNSKYYVVHFYQWFNSSRIRKVLSHNIEGVWLSSAYANSPDATCDLYIGCRSISNPQLFDSFPELTELDAIMSAPETYVYNCISWSGGITDYWEWPTYSTSEYYSPEGDLACFDNFYAAERYPGCMRYTRTGATETNSILNLWGLTCYDVFSYTHASVQKPANNHPHGYSWESKLGSYERVFHPTKSLVSYGPRCGGYGDVAEYYIQAPSPSMAKNMLLDESVAEGLSAIESVRFTTQEKAIIGTLKTTLSSNERELFEEKYRDWVVSRDNPTMKIYSNPQKFTELEEYTALISYCQSIGNRIWPMIYEKYEQGDFYLTCMLEDLIIPGHENLLAEVKAENKAKKYTKDGRFIVRTSFGNGMKFIQKLLGDEAQTKSPAGSGLVYSNTDLFELAYNSESQVLSVNFDLADAATITLSVYDLNGREIKRLISNERMSSGSHVITAEISASGNPVYLIKYLVNGNTNIKKLHVNK